MQCDLEHDSNHNIILFRNIKPNINDIRNKMEELKSIIDTFNNNIDEMIIFLKNIKNNIEKYYIIYDTLINKYNMRKRNYQIFYNINNIDNSIIMNDLKEIIYEKNISDKFNKIYNLHTKIKTNDIKSEEMNTKEKDFERKNNLEPFKYENEINLVYKTNKKDKYRIFGRIFSENNENNIELIINNAKSRLLIYKTCLKTVMHYIISMK